MKMPGCFIRVFFRWIFDGNYAIMTRIFETARYTDYE